MTFNYTCPKCGWPMFCVSTASIPPIIRYECNCGYKSKPISEPMTSAPLPMEYREENEKECLK